MRKLLLTLSCICFLAVFANAQSTGTNYKTALGAKIYFGNGTSGGINVKHFLTGPGALEGSLLFAEGALGIEGLYEWHGNITGAAGLKWYVGGGGIIAFSTEKNTTNDVLFGLRGTIGVDYKFTGAPICIAFDLDPTFILAPATDFDFGAGLAFRFAF